MTLSFADADAENEDKAAARIIGDGGGVNEENKEEELEDKKEPTAAAAELWSPKAQKVGEKRLSDYDEFSRRRGKRRKKD